LHGHAFAIPRNAAFLQNGGIIALCQLNAIERLKLFPKIDLKRGSVTDLVAILVFQAAQLLNEAFFKLAFG